MKSSGADSRNSTSRLPVVDALALHKDDNVGTALRALAAGESVRVQGGGLDVRIELRQAIPLCHKFALRAVPVGHPITKYGEAIGRASHDIAPGDHVHVHNLVSVRAQRA